jgi:hypothetical protein
MCRCIVLDFCLWRRSAGAALINEDNAVVVWVKESPTGRRRSCARATVKKYHGHAIFVSAFFPVNAVQFIDV